MPAKVDRSISGDTKNPRGYRTCKREVAGSIPAAGSTETPARELAHRGKFFIYSLYVHLMYIRITKRQLEALPTRYINAALVYSLSSCGSTSSVAVADARSTSLNKCEYMSRVVDVFL